MPQQTFTPGQVLTAAEMMLIPQGLLGSAGNGSQSAISASSTPGTAITGMSITVTVAGSRTLLLEAQLAGTFSGNGLAFLAIFESSTVLGVANFQAQPGDINQGTVRAVVNPSAGAHTYFVTLWVQTGTFTPRFGSDSSIFTVTDV